MSEMLVLLDVKPEGRHSALPLESKRSRLARLLVDLRKKLDEGIEDHDLCPDVAEDVMECMSEEADFHHAWRCQLDDWKDDALEWPDMALYATELRAALEDVESAFWSVRLAEEQEMEARRLAAGGKKCRVSSDQ